MITLSASSALFGVALGVYLAVISSSPQAAVISAVVLAGSLGLSWVCYRNAVEAAVAYGERVRSTVDLYRFLVLDAMRLPPPETWPRKSSSGAGYAGFSIAVTGQTPPPGGTRRRRRAAMAEADEAALIELMVGFARSTLAREAQGRSLTIDPSSLKVFKVVRFDVDGDGEDEICFAAGAAEFFSQGVCGLLDPSPEGPRFVELVPFQEGFRDLVVADVDNDGHPEIVTWAQVGSGAFLSLAILRYDGSAVTSLFPDGPFHQGLLETKDLDLDGVDELVIWEGRWEKGAHWQPNPFTIHVYHAAPGGYRLAFSHRLTTSYYPSSDREPDHRPDRDPDGDRAPLLLGRGATAAVRVAARRRADNR